jgi:Fe-S cluster assembly protein SufD
MTIHHTMPNTHSDMLFKGILENKSRAAFTGRVQVAKEAVKVVAHQANHNIVLSNTAEVYSKPELEIYADDVKCKHGATIGQLDQDALFYLRSRGISQADATNLLLRGFADDVIQRISHPDIKYHIQSMVDAE